MKLSRYFPAGQFRWILIISLGLCLAYLGENLFFWGGEATAKAINDYSSPIVAIFASLFAMSLWNNVSWEKNASRIWGAVTLGFSLWTLAEVVWAFYTLVEQEIPYPSAADVLWLAGYPALFMALLWRYNGLRVRANGLQIFFVALFSLVSAAYLFFLLFWPLVQSLLGEFTASLLLAIAYPFLDLPLITLSLMIALALGGGRFSAPWGWLALNFFFRLLSDIGFAYATWNGSYYPEGRLTDISGFIDYTYNISYIFVFLGLYLQQTLARQLGRDLPQEQVAVERVSYANCMLFTNAEDTLISVSPNFLKLLGLPDDTTLIGEPVWVALQMPAEAFDNLRQTARKETVVKEWPHVLARQEGLPLNLTLSAVAAFSDRREFTGLNLLARVVVPEEDLSSLELQAEQRDLAASILTQLGMEKSAQQQELKAYFYAEFKALYNLMLDTSGPSFATTFLGILRLTSNQHNWNVEVAGQEVLLPRGRQELSAEDLKTLLTALRDYAQKAAGPDLMRDTLRSLQTKLSQNVLETAKKQGLLLDD